MLDKLLEMLSGKKEVKEVSVGIVTGELHDDWQRKSCDQSLLELELEAKKSEFALDFFKRNVVDGKLQVDVEVLGFLASDTFKKECTDFITNHKRRKLELSRKEGELWSQTYEKLEIPSDRKYSIDIISGEVFEVVIGGEGE